MSDATLPDVVREFADQHPEVWEAYNQLGDAVAQAGPLDEKTQRLIKLGIAIGAGRQGAVHSHARRGLKQGIAPEELRQAAMLGITTTGWPGAFAAYCWVEDMINRQEQRQRQ